ncbi:hypothetical protein [Microbispora sp. NBRC 16548]|uniref:hypothetical protein n=1 Tax=Microbispora sp. NBRC 16548 TaxID=3030994 RepID=UPI0024A31D50|nr:hypothetical protein [Microbispora sp. NBRC 16548]GLX08284.1 hypothetical protein Misp03_52100 [Microbispora sp. NBRC 16548]
MTLRLRLIVPLTLAAGLMMSACSEPEPTAAEAGQVLKTHIDQTMKNVRAVDVKVTDPGGKDIACGDGKYKRTYAVKATSGAGSGNPETVILMLVSALKGAGDYELIGTDVNAATQEAVNAQYHTRITVSSPAQGKIAAQGETDCLPSR